MILKFKYHADSGLLEAYRSYTLAQNNSLSDTVVITSTAADAGKYNYCLEFICYNSKSIPKAQYISPILNYGDDGISFALPNNLTEYRGHVDMQLTGYDPDDNSIVFKSISKNCKAFDVEGSLCVLEKDLNETPNVFTEVLKQLEDLRQIHQDIIDEAMEQYGQQFFDKVAGFKWYHVRYYDNGKLIDERFALAGAKLTPPQFTLPEQCVLAGGWYNPATERLWDLQNDTVEGDTQLYLNYITDDVVIEDGVVTSLGKHVEADIYVPEFYDGKKVTACSPNISQFVPAQSHIHLCSNIYATSAFEDLLANANIAGLYFPDNITDIICENGYIYVDDGVERILVYAPKCDILRPMSGCTAINSYSINNNKNLCYLLLPESVIMINENAIEDTGIEELILTPSVLYVAREAVYNNFNLKKVIINSDISMTLADETFINVDVFGNVTRPTLYVLPQYYERYKARNLAYDIKVIGQEYLDGAYASKGE